MDIKGGKYLHQNKRRDEPTQESDCMPKWSCTKILRRDTVVGTTDGIGTPYSGCIVQLVMQQ